MSIKKMTPEQWIAVMPNPRQRPTDVHAAKAIKNHLKKYSITQDTVFAAAIPGGKLVKLDGHTRAYLWQQGLLEKPPCVFVRVYMAKNMEDAKELYTHFDTKAQMENQMDIAGGALAEYSIKPVSGLFIHKANTSALTKLAGHSKSIYQIVGGWKREIQLLDAIGFSKNSLKSGAVLGALVIFRAFQEQSATDFFQQIQRDEGTKTAQGSDAVQMFQNMHSKKGEGHAEKQIWEMAGKTIALYKGFVEKKRYRQCPPAVDVRGLISSAEA